MCVQTGSVKEHLTRKVILEKIREYMGYRRTECHKRNYEKSGRSVKDENRCLHPTDNLVGWPRFYASFDNTTMNRKNCSYPFCPFVLSHPRCSEFVADGFFYFVWQETGCLRIGENKSVFVILKINLFLYYVNIIFCI